MARPELLNNVTHKDLKVITKYSADYGDNVNSVMTFPTEYADIEKEYPIFFRKDAQTGEFHSIALLGFERGENLFLNNSEWDASYVPGMILRGPFMIGFQSREVGGEIVKDPVIHVDMENPRVSETEGEDVFLTHGGNSPYLERIASTLKGIRDGMELSKVMLNAFNTLGLIESVALEIQLNKEQTVKLNGYYTISEEKLKDLDGASLEKLNRNGFLQGAYLVLSSLANVKKLIDRKNHRRQQEHLTATQS